jgi:hypothetical protein
MRHERTFTVIDCEGVVDVFDLPDERRVSLSELHDSRDSFQAVGIDDYTATDKVIANNGHSYFATRM